jgi:hypothetical protein
MAFAVDADLVRYFSTLFSFNPSHEEKKSFLIALIQVDLTGLKYAA